MSILEAIREIETHNFAARVGVASGFRTLVHAVSSEKAVDYLLSDENKGKVLGLLLQRVSALSGLRTDPRFEDPWDSALAAYLLVLQRRDLDVARVAAAIVADLPRCWWARRVSHSILWGHARSGNSLTVQSELGAKLAGAPFRVALSRAEPSPLTLTAGVRLVGDVTPEIAMPRALRAGSLRVGFEEKLGEAEDEMCQCPAAASYSLQQVAGGWR